MRVHQIEVENFRSLRKETLKCDPLTVLVGANGAGKSNLLHALRIFYDVNSKIGEEDFYAKDTKAVIVIRVTYADLNADEQKEFASFIRNSVLSVTKRITWTDGKVEQKYFAATDQFPKFVTLRSGNKTEQVTGWNALISDGTLPAGTVQAKRGDDVMALMAAFELANKALLVPVDREEQFFGPKNVGGGKLDNFTKFVYLPAVRDVLDDVTPGKSNTMAQLLDALVMRKLTARADVVAFKTEFHDKLKVIYESSRATDLAPMSKAITDTLQEYLPNSTFGLTFNDPLMPDVPVPLAIPSIDEDGYAGDVARKGHGLQRVLIFTLLQHLAMSRQEPPKAAVAAAGTQPGLPAPSAGPDLILAIEEPEIYQHPQRCRYLADVLLKLSSDPARGLGERNQVLYTTHSPYFVGLDRFTGIRLVRKIKAAGDPAPRSTISFYTLSQAATALATVAAADPKVFTADSFRARTYPVMTLAVSEGFFANAVVLVEGLTEAAVLYAVAERVKAEWARKGISVVPVVGKANLDRPAVVFRGLNIPTFVVFDGDSQYRGKGNKEESSTKKQNAICLRLVGATSITDFPSTSVESNWACFEDCIETEMQKELGGEFAGLRDAVATKLGYTEPARAMKNYDVATAFVDAVYDSGKKLSVLESIVQKITALAP